MTTLVQVGLPRCCHEQADDWNHAWLEFCWARVKVGGRGEEIC